MPAPNNLLFYGDNLDVLRLHVKDESVDLVYLDPPFKSDQNYNVLFEEKDGTAAAAQIQVFEDTWTWDEAASRAYEETVERGGAVSSLLRGMRMALGDNDMLAYLAMMAPRLVELHRVLKPTGSMYLHCDVTASAYLRLLLDAVFGPKNFRNEIIWYYYNKMHDRRKRLLPRATDTLLFYVKDVNSDFTFHHLKEEREKPVKQLLRKKVGGRMVNVKDADGHVVYRLKADRGIDNVWRIPALQPAAREKLDYPTQKPEVLLERVIATSTNPGDLVLDPFCGCGTSIVAAEKLGRRWIGIDVTSLATSLIKWRITGIHGSSAKYEVVGEPTTLADARVLAASDPYQFQWWALGLVKARPTEKKKGADQGIDGRLLFHEGDGATKEVILSVKAGKVQASHVRDLIGVMKREGAEIGALLSLEPPTAPMRKEAASAGFYSSPWGKHPRVQLVTVADLLAGKELDHPKTAGTLLTYKQAPRHIKKVAEQQDVFGADGD